MFATPSLPFPAADVDVAVVGAAVGQPLVQPWVSVISEDHWLVFGEQIVKIEFAQAVQMFARGLEPHEVDNVDDANFLLGQMLAHDGTGGQRFQLGHIAATGHDHIGRGTLIVAGPPAKR